MDTQSTWYSRQCTPHHYLNAITNTIPTLINESIVRHFSISRLLRQSIDSYTRYWWALLAHLFRILHFVLSIIDAFAYFCSHSPPLLLHTNGLHAFTYMCHFDHIISYFADTHFSIFWTYIEFALSCYKTFEPLFQTEVNASRPYASLGRALSSQYAPFLALLLCHWFI